MTTKIKELFSQKKSYIPGIEKKDYSFIDMQLINDWSGIRKTHKKYVFLKSLKN